MKMLYIHMPFCVSKCGYCDFVSGNYDVKTQKKYVKALINEAGNYGGKIETIYIGGGTPSVLYDGGILSLVENLKEIFDMSNVKEFTIEINPDSLTSKKIEEYKKSGINRVSVGVQNTNDKVLQSVGRRHNAKQAINALKLLANAGFRVSADVMLGLPESGAEDVLKTIEDVTNAGAEHVSMYMLESDRYQTDGDKLADLYETAYEKLKELGFSRYEISNFAKNGAISKHNYGYWTGAEYIGLGVAAHGFLGGARYANTSNISLYLGGEKPEITQLTKEELLYERIILGLRTAKGISASILDGKSKEIVKNNLRFFDENDGYLSIKEKYTLVSNSILAKF